MSRRKLIKRGSSVYLNNWNLSAKRFVNICNICGGQGYSPVILESDFYDKRPNLHSEKRAIYEQLTRTLKPLPLDVFGRCEICARIQK